MNTNNTLNQYMIEIPNNIMIQNTELINDINNNKIISLTKSKLENENTINLLQKSLKNINISNQELKQENSILKAKLKNKDIFLEKLEIEHLKDESELNSLKKINMNLSEELDNIKLKNKSIIDQLNKKDLLIEKLNQNKEERENKLINTQILISNAVKDYELYIQLNNKYENDIKKLKSKIKFFKEENIKLENINKSLNKKIVQYEQNIMQLKTELLKTKKNLGFMTSDKQELLMTNERLKNDLMNMSIENRKNIFLKNNIEEENALIKNQILQNEYNMNVLRTNNEMLLNNKKNLDRNLEILLDKYNNNNTYEINSNNNNYN